MPDPAGCLLTVIIFTLVLLACQPVSDFMLGSARCHLTILTFTLVVVSQQMVSKFMSSPVGCCLMILTFTLAMVDQQMMSEFILVARQPAHRCELAQCPNKSIVVCPVLPHFLKTAAAPILPLYPDPSVNI